MKILLINLEMGELSVPLERASNCLPWLTEMAKLLQTNITPLKMVVELLELQILFLGMEMDRLVDRPIEGIGMDRLVDRHMDCLMDHLMNLGPCQMEPLKMATVSSFNLDGSDSKGYVSETAPEPNDSSGRDSEPVPGEPNDSYY